MDIVGLTYSGVIFTGGAIGYFKAGSTHSLVTGLIFGLAALYGSHKMGQNPKNVHVLLITSAVLGMLMGQRFYKNPKVFPSGVLTTLSALVAARCGLRLLGVNTI